MKLVEYPDRDLAAMGLSDALASNLRQALSMEDRISMAVPGGTTPGPVFDILSAADLDWSRVSVMLSDERWVPEDHPRSNTALVRARLLCNRAAAATFVPFYREGASAEQAAPEVSEALGAHLPLSVLLLGMGSDMHTASLFPGAAELDAALGPEAPALCAIAPEDQPEARVTLSARVLNAAMQKHLIIFGDEKKQALERAVHLPAHEAPIAAVIQGGTVHWAP